MADFNERSRASDIMQYGLMILGFTLGWFGYLYINQVSGQGNWGFLLVAGVVLVTIAAAVISIYLNIVLHDENTLHDVKSMIEIRAKTK